MEEEHAKEASLLDILRFAKPEHKVIILGLFFTILRGMSTPIFSIVYGRLFLSLSSAFASHGKDISTENIINSASFASLGLFAGLTTFFSGSLFGFTGERMSKRLRIRVFGNLLRQDGKFFDDFRHSTGKLTSRLASDAPNVKQLNI